MEAQRQVGRCAAEGDVQMLRWLHKSGECSLGAKSELGTSCAYLAVLHDRPAVLRLLHECGVDLAKPCDAVGYGPPAFWAAKYGREHCLLELFSLGVDLNLPCERHGRDAYQMAAVCGNHSAIDRVAELKKLRNKAAACIQAHIRGVLSRKAARELKIKAGACVRIQRIMRGNVVRILRGFKAWKARPVKDRVARRHAGATLVNALVRGFLVRAKM
mmetsp:Transcript_1415/g.2865  ORF Transcript_1415/g.2865 Transcript_1415/m.2865 type:complete len:216 (+) Transcript_1415:240-887(+)